MVSVEDVYILWLMKAWQTIEVEYTYIWDNPEWNTEFQWYRNWIAIEWENTNEYTLLITDQSCEICCAVCPIDSLGNEWEITLSNVVEIDYRPRELTAVEKQYLIKLYDSNMDFIKILPTSVVTNDISFSETINAWQWALTLNVNLDIETTFFDWVMYCKIFESDNRWNDDLLIYSWRLSKIDRNFSNNKENVNLTFLSLFSLLNDVYFKDWQGEFIFQIEDDPANIIKTIIDYFVTIYPNTLSYTNESIDEYWEDVYIAFDTILCGDALNSVLSWLNWYLFVWADWVVHFHARLTQITHKFTYEKDITELSVPNNYEQVANAVYAQYKYVWWSHTWLTDVAIDSTSITKYWRKEKIVSNENLYWDTSAEKYRDAYLQDNKDWKQSINITVNNLYDIESIHPWDTIKIRNIWLPINDLQIKQIKYTYQSISMQLEYYTSLSEQIFKS